MTVSSVDAAVASLIRRQPAVGTEDVGLVDALYRILAEDVRAEHPIPPFACSAMDGYAYEADHLINGTRLQVVATVAAGHPLVGRLPSGTAARIFTGGVMPVGADTVALQEDCSVSDGWVLVPNHLSVGANVRPAGDDIEAGEVVLHRGSRVRPQDIAMIASVGRTKVGVYRQLKVGVLATGDELRQPGDLLAPGCIYNSNGPMVGALARSLGASVTDLGIVRDNPQVVKQKLREAARLNDLVISSGGMSVGDEDHVASAVKELGNLDFWKLDLKPGRPVGMGEIHGTPFIGLPGNPVSAMVTFLLLARPLILRLMGAEQINITRIPAVASFSMKRARGRREYLRGLSRRAADHTLMVDRSNGNGSAMINSLVWADGLIEIPEDCDEILAGDVLNFVPFNAVLK